MKKSLTADPDPTRLAVTFGEPRLRREDSTKRVGVDEYIASAPEEVRGKLLELRTIIKEVAPAAEEKISYGMPYYGYKGRLVYFSYAKDHIGLYAMPGYLEGYESEIQKYRTGKATIAFPLSEDLPTELIRELIKVGVQHNDEAKK